MKTAMTLKDPFCISSRLLPCIRVSGAAIQLEYAGTTSDRRTRYRWTIDLPQGSEHTGDDLKSGCGGGSLQDGFESLLSFLAAAGESFKYAERHDRDGMEGENSNLFPRAVAEWASTCTDELYMASIELEESEEDLIEE